MLMLGIAWQQGAIPLQLAAIERAITLNGVAVAEKQRLDLESMASESLALEAAHSLYKLMAYKDEYEVARLYNSPTFKDQLAQQFEGDFTLNFHMAPPWISQMGSNGRPLKRQAMAQFANSAYALRNAQ